MAGYTADANSLVSYCRNAAQVSIAFTCDQGCLALALWRLKVSGCKRRSVLTLPRASLQGHLSSYNEDMPVEQLVQKICDLKQGYTQFGGLRPFGVSFLFAGHDPHHELQLYATDPSGNYSGWKATCIGANNSTAQSLLRQDFRDDMGLDEAMGLALKVLSKTMDSTTMDSEKREC